MNIALWTTRFREYLKACNRAERTAHSYGLETRRLCLFLQSLGIESLSQVKRDDVVAYRAHLRECTHRGRLLSASSQAYRLSAVKSFMRFLVRERFLAYDPAADVELPKVPEVLPRAPLSDREMQRFLDSCTGNNPVDIRNRAMLEVLYSTAIRNTELRSLTLESVDLGQQLLHLHATKRMRSRVVPLGDEATEWLRTYMERARPQLLRDPQVTIVFLSTTGRQIERAKLAIIVRDMARQTGLKKPVTPHLIRNCCLTHMLKNGADLRHLQELAGHASLKTMQRYIRIETTDLRKVLERCHPREKRHR